MRYDKVKRAFFVQKFIELKSIIRVQRAFKTKFKVLHAPDKKTIKNCLKKFIETGDLKDKPRIPAQPTIRQKIREKAKNDISVLIKKFPKLSINKLKSSASVSYGLAHKVLTKDLNLFPYKPQVYKRIPSHSFPKRVKFANWFLDLPKDASKFLICCDESIFYLNPVLNKQNDRIWLPTRPKSCLETDLHPEYVMVWCAISANHVFGPYYFEGTVNNENYLEMLQNSFWPEMLRTRSYKEYYFIQDGAPPHKKEIVQDWLKSKFGDRFVDKNLWPPYSADLNPCDYFLWGYIKPRVYNPMPKTIDQLKQNIEREMNKLKKDMLGKVFSNFEKRLCEVVKRNGKRIEKK